MNWNAVTAPANCTISSYSIFGSTTSGFTPSAGNLIASGIATPGYTRTGLAASTTYYYAVEAIDADGTSAASAQASAETSPASSGAEIIAIAAGGPAQSNSGGGYVYFIADEDVSGGGDNAVASTTINLAQPGVNAAPMAVYQHARSGVFTYTIPGLTAGGTYTVLLHFAETYFTAAGDREFNVAINGTTVLANLDIYATVGVNAALLEQFSATANSSGDIVIAFTAGAANQPVVSGIEIRGSSGGSCNTVPPAPTGLAATATSSSSISLGWTGVTPPANCTIGSYNVYRSTTSGFTPATNNLVASGVTSPGYVNAGLAASTSYYYVVEALDAEGGSAASSQTSATTQAASGEILAIACGGPAESNSSGGDYPFVADEGFSGGGDNSVSSSSITLTQPGTNAAPTAVYQHARAGVFTYTIPGLTAGTQHSVLLHFAETYFTAKGNREFNVAINGTTVLTNLDIYGAVGLNAALLETFTATANSSGQIVIAFTEGAADQPVVSGIEVR